MFNECRIRENIGKNEERNEKRNMTPIECNISYGDFNLSLKSLKERSNRALENSLRIIDPRYFN